MTAADDENGEIEEVHLLMPVEAIGIINALQLRSVRTLTRAFCTESSSSGFPSRVGIEFRMKRGDIPVYETTTASLKDLMLLAESDVLVGTGSSSFFSVSLLLSAAWKRALPPYVSLDAAYCDRWRMCCDVMPDGSSVVC